MIKAQAEADANKLLEESLTEKVLRKALIDKWNGELPKVSSTTGTIFDVTGYTNDSKISVPEISYPE